MALLNQLFGMDGIPTQDLEALLQQAALAKLQQQGIPANLEAQSTAQRIAAPAPTEVKSFVDQGTPYAAPQEAQGVQIPTAALQTAGSVGAPVESKKRAPARSDELGGLETVATFLSGLGKGGGALLPALGGGMSAVQQGQRSRQSENATVALLMKQGLDEATALAVTRNPQVQQQVLLSMVPTRPTPFDLNPGGKRFDGHGRLIASNDESKLPPGFRSDGQGGMTYIKGGPGDPEYIRQTTGAKDTSGATLNREQAKEAVGRVKLYKSEADTAETLLGDLGQLREMRKGVSYEGGFFPGARARAGAIFSDGAGQALHSKALEIQLGFTEKTKGAITDREMATFKAATPGLDMADAAAETVMNGMEAAALRVRERSKFFEAYLNQNRSLAGAQEAWDTFKNEKPVITGDGKGGFKVNRENIAAWKDYLGGGGSAGGGDPLADARAAIAKGAPKDAVEQRLRDLGIDPAGL
jgi:hypothetical protein